LEIASLLLFQEEEVWKVGASKRLRHFIILTKRFPVHKIVAWSSVTEEH
jgi:hypothetical protein